MQKAVYMAMAPHTAGRMQIRRLRLGFCGLGVAGLCTGVRLQQQQLEGHSQQAYYNREDEHPLRPLRKLLCALIFPPVVG